MNRYYSHLIQLIFRPLTNPFDLIRRRSYHFFLLVYILQALFYIFYSKLVYFIYLLHKFYYLYEAQLINSINIKIYRVMHSSTFRRSLDYRVVDIRPFDDELRYLSNYPSRDVISPVSTIQWVDINLAKKQLQLQREVQRKLILQEKLAHQRSRLIFEDLMSQSRKKGLMTPQSYRRQNYSQPKQTFYDKYDLKGQRQLRSEKKPSFKYFENNKTKKFKYKTSEYPINKTELKQYQRDNCQFKQLISKKLTQERTKTLKDATIKSLKQEKKQVTNLYDIKLYKQIQELKQKLFEKDQKITALQKLISQKQKESKIKQNKSLLLFSNQVNLILEPYRTQRQLSVCNSTCVSLSKTQQKDARQTRQSFFNTTGTTIKNFDMKGYQLKQTLFLNENSVQSQSQSRSNGDINAQSFFNTPINYHSITQSIQFNNHPPKLQIDNGSLTLSVSQVIPSERKITKKVSKKPSQLQMSLNLSIQKPQYVKNIKKKQSYDNVDLSLSQSLQVAKMKKKLTKLESYAENISIILEQQSVTNSENLQSRKSLQYSEFNSINNEKILQNLAKNGYYFQENAKLQQKMDNDQDQQVSQPNYNKSENMQQHFQDD